MQTEMSYNQNIFIDNKNTFSQLLQKNKSIDHQLIT